ncbi:2-amino-4-hydroxy-6-hydroxymethyldihydropteridine diphosphokinase [Marinimicrobium sp. ABcell2]|uniref:2-amino-4-hydroxy-6- hydroxymethyldihydropteridine diphosphokinase n=1 Tax=Marinimicrobium sp. ABcell2 TaxID=3069751 RepID=UPI0027AEFE5E|nr:2-amino-4-hydroxy-6-hydroxymethyldihydropteridine diphosphokinase [Marinimicrobium sp. ABcell2]MDQ2077581.1 2-amino-4-hydroxy-6-hydroxymethyldihydropteridine diphosphokinase [Marinimicrobium sp. ABcell2]
MTSVYLSLGSNIDRHRHIKAGLDALAEQFGDLTVSSVFESEAVGFSGNNFLNLAVGIDTDLSVAELSEQLKGIEAAHGRERQAPKFSSRTLDIDILTYDDWVGEQAGVRLPRPEIIQNAFVLQPLAEIAPDQKHPELNLSYAELWRRYDKTTQILWPVDFHWRGQQVSVAK